MLLDQVGSEIEDSMQTSVKEQYGVAGTTTVAWDEMQIEVSQ